MNTPDWALTLSFWLHMLATVTWVGGLVVVSLVILPIARRSLGEESYPKFLRAVNKRLDPIGWFGLAVLTVTGLIQMSANPNYEGFLAVNNPWARAILLKHIAFLFIIAFSAYQTWTLTPALERAALRQARGKDNPEAPQLQRRERNLMRANLVLSLVVLLLTAWARIA
jgi:uncharacterized membrane protein